VVTVLGETPSFRATADETARFCDLHEDGYAGNAIHDITPSVPNNASRTTFRG
jgi:hypothetical protein